MSPHLPWPIVITYCIYAIFAAQQKFCIRSFKGGNQIYNLILGYFAFVTSLFGIVFLIFYALRTTWWAPVILFILGLLSYIPFMILEGIVEKIVPLTIWGMLSFVAIPICAVLLVHFTLLL